ncbi:MAG: HAD family hydrolase [Thermoproteota archaeon]|nr:HAD family hydrolase [Thermoproteota archaeon]
MTLHNLVESRCLRANIKAALFDLHGTLAYAKTLVTDEEASDYLVSRGYEVYPQEFGAALYFVSFVDYPKHGYKTLSSFFNRVLWRLDVNVDKKTLNGLTVLFKRRCYELYPDAKDAVIKAKEHGLKTAIVTTIAHFWFEKALQPIKNYFNMVMTGFEAGCEKTNPKMYRKTLKTLDVNPEEAVMIGDRLKIDVLLPKKLGMHGILLDREGGGQEVVHADAVAKNLTDAVHVIAKWI